VIQAELDRLRNDGALLRSIVSSKVALKRAGREWKGLCPFHNENTPSFTVFDDGHYHCYGCGAHGTSFDFIMKAEGVDFREACRRLEAEAGIATTPMRKANGMHKGDAHKDDVWKPMVPPPSDAPRPTDQQLACDMLHEYRDAGDRLLLYVRRHEANGGRRKQFVPLTYGTLNGKTGWHDKAPAAPRPLYRLNALSHAPADAQVLLCEGEKAAEAAQRILLDYVAMTWLGGANAAERADLTPLTGRAVILWPDADEAGRQAMARIAARLPHAKVVDTADLSDGFDAADLERLGIEDADDWLDARLREPERRDEDHGLPQVVWRDVRLSDWADRQVPEREWIVPDWIPCEQVTGLYGIGGINKTDFVMQHDGQQRWSRLYGEATGGGGSGVWAVLRGYRSRDCPPRLTHGGTLRPQPGGLPRLPFRIPCRLRGFGIHDLRWA
jgi:hypothetical protein